jgi:DNA repair exonuclease SbcCD nuclease subunit
MIADTHLFRDDHRGSSYVEYSRRMSKAYNTTKHFQTGLEINPEIAFQETLKIAKEQKSSLIVLAGDIFSFPSEAAIEWVIDKMDGVGINYVYTAGNHDWHYEGMEGSSETLRDTWINKRLTPLYQGENPLMQKIEINGINFIVLDNSTYEINPEQLVFFNACLSEKKPCVLLVHIPLYAPGRPVGFGCGHPEWGAKTDRSFTLEKRMKWRETGHTKTTMDFYEAVIGADNLIGVLTGHIHNQSVDVINGIPQIVSEANAKGGYLQVHFAP